MKKLIFSSALAMSTMSMAAEFRCFEFSPVLVLTRNTSTVMPAVVTRRVVISNETTIFKQEVIALNEETDNFLASRKEGEKICLKGRNGKSGLMAFFAYEAKVDTSN